MQDFLGSLVWGTVCQSRDSLGQMLNMLAVPGLLKLSQMALELRTASKQQRRILERHPLSSMQPHVSVLLVQFRILMSGQHFPPEPRGLGRQQPPCQCDPSIVQSVLPVLRLLVFSSRPRSPVAPSGSVFPINCRTAPFRLRNPIRPTLPNCSPPTRAPRGRVCLVSPPFLPAPRLGAQSAHVHRGQDEL